MLGVVECPSPRPWRPRAAVPRGRAPSLDLACAVCSVESCVLGSRSREWPRSESSTRRTILGRRQHRGSPDRLVAADHSNAARSARRPFDPDATRRLRELDPRRPLPRRASASACHRCWRWCRPHLDGVGSSNGNSTTSTRGARPRLQRVAPVAPIAAGDQRRTSAFVRTLW